MAPAGGPEVSWAGRGLGAVGLAPRVCVAGGLLRGSWSRGGRKEVPQGGGAGGRNPPPLSVDSSWGALVQSGPGSRSFLASKERSSWARWVGSSPAEPALVRQPGPANIESALIPTGNCLFLASATCQTLVLKALDGESIKYLQSSTKGGRWHSHVTEGNGL